MNYKIDKYLVPFLLLVFAYGVAEVWNMPIQARLFPWVLGLLGLALIIWLLLQEVTTSGEGKGETEASADFGFTAEEASEKGQRGAWETFGWIFGFILGLWLFGFHIVLPLMVFLYLVRHGERWTVTLGLTAGTGLVFWAVFDNLLHLPFPPGVFFDWLGWS